MSTIKTFWSKMICRLIAATYDAALGQFPAVVRIETTNACNARCTICPHGDIQRPICRMDEALFTRVIDECAECGCTEVHLHNFGEPLLDKHLEDRVRYRPLMPGGALSDGVAYVFDMVGFIEVKSGQRGEAVRKIVFEDFKGTKFEGVKDRSGRLDREMPYSLGQIWAALSTPKEEPEKPPADKEAPAKPSTKAASKAK